MTSALWGTEACCSIHLEMRVLDSDPKRRHLEFLIERRFDRALNLKILEETIPLPASMRSQRKVSRLFRMYRPKG